jgi:hypothetical protein
VLDTCGFEHGATLPARDIVALAVDDAHEHLNSRHLSAHDELALLLGRRHVHASGDAALTAYQQAEEREQQA